MDVFDLLGVEVVRGVAVVLLLLPRRTTVGGVVAELGVVRELRVCRAVTRRVTGDVVLLEVDLDVELRDARMSVR